MPSLTAFFGVLDGVLAHGVAAGLAVVLDELDEDDALAQPVVCSRGLCSSQSMSPSPPMLPPSGGRDMHVSTRPRSVGHAAGQCAARATLAVLACADHRAPRFESGRGAMAARAATAAAATRAGRTLRIERAGRRGHGPMRARRAWAAASMPQSRAKYARRRRVLRRAAAAYGVVYLAFYSARDV